MSSVPPSTSRGIQFVKAQKADSDSGVIQSRMGMTVSEFLSSLESTASLTSQLPHSPPKVFVWPKHTLYELLDPSTTVYQRPPTDISWFVRFTALGRYRPPSDLHRECPESFPKHPNPSLCRINPEHDRSTSLSGDWSTAHAVNLDTTGLLDPAISTAQHHLLVEDLKLSDSEDDEREDDMDATKPMVDANGYRQDQNTPDVSLPNAKLSWTGVLGSPPQDRVHETSDCSRFLHQPNPDLPPFISPLSVMGEDAAELKAITDGCFVNEVVVYTEADVNVNATEAVQKSPFSLSDPSTSVSIYTKSATPIVQVTEKPNIHQKLSSQKPSSPFISDVRMTEIPVSNLSTTKSLAVCNNEDQKSTEMKSSNRHFIQRLLTESVAVLSAKQNCYVADLSPRAKLWSTKENSISLRDKENLMVSTCLPKSNPLEKGVTGSACAKSPTPLPISKIPPFSNRASQPLVHSPAVETNGIKAFDHLPPIDVPFTGSCEPLVKGKLFESCASESPKGAASRVRLPTASNRTACTVSDPVYIDVKPTVSSPLRISNSVAHPKCPNKSLKATDSMSSDKSCDVSSVVDHPLKKPAPYVSDEAPYSDRVSMPPPDPGSNKVKRGSSRPLNSDSKVDQPFPNDDDGAMVLDNQARLCPAPSQCIDENKLPQPASSLPTVQSVSLTGSIPPIPVFSEPIRSIPSERWVFSDMPLTMVRLKLQNVSRIREDVSNCANASPQYKLLEKVRSILNSSVSSNCIRDGTQGRKSRSRTLTGVLVVPPKPTTTCDNIVPCLSASFSSVPSPSKRVDAFCMTSPVPTPKIVEVSHTHVQCDLVTASVSNQSVSASAVNSSCTTPLISNEQVISTTGGICDVTASICPNCSTKLVGKNSVDCSTRVSLDVSHLQGQRLAVVEEDRIRKEGAVSQLQIAEEYKNKASRCWKSIVAAITSTRSGSHSSSNGLRHQLLLELDALHQYPVELLLGIRHLISASFVLEDQGDFLRAADVLANASSQLNHINHRLQTVEAKLVKIRTRHQGKAGKEVTPDRLSEQSMRIKQNASWIRLWYYIVVRLRSVIGFREYDLRMKLSDISSNKIDEVISGLSSEVDHGTDDNGSASATTTVSTDSLRCLVQTCRLHSIAKEAAIEWGQANKLAADVPRWYTADGSNDASSNPNVTNLDIEISNAVCAPAWRDWNLSTGTLLLFVDDVIKVHLKILEKLKYESVSSQNVDCVNSASDALPTSASPVAHSTMNLAISSPVNKPSAIHTNFDGRPKDTARSQLDERSSELSSTNDSAQSKRVKRRRLLPSEKITNVSIPSTAVDSPPSTSTTNTDMEFDNTVVSRDLVLKNDKNCEPPSSRTLPVRKTPKSVEVNEPKRSSSRFVNTEKPVKLKRLHNKDENASDIMVKAETMGKSKSKDVTSRTSKTDEGPTYGETTHGETNDLCGDRLDDNGSPDYPPSSPSPSRIRRRSCSLAPPVKMKKSLKVLPLIDQSPESISHPQSGRSGNDSPGNTYQPKRVRKVGRKSHRTSRSGSDRSGCSPVPLYRPSAASAVPDESRSRNIRASSVGLSLSFRGQDEDISNDSIKYSPTKQVFIDCRSSKNRPSKEPVPVYRVSRISSPPRMNGSCVPSAEPSKPKPNDRPPAKSDRFRKEELPSFYSRWKNEPPTHASAVNQVKRYHL